MSSKIIAILFFYCGGLNVIYISLCFHLSVLSSPSQRSLRRIINETDFTGVSGRVRFTGGLSRYSDIQVFQWINKSSELIGRFLPVARTKLTKPTSVPP